MTARPTVSVAATTGLVEAISAAGADADEILRAVGLKRSALANADGFIPSAAFALALEEAARATGDEFFGLHFGERFDPKDLGALTYVVVNSPTVSAACHNIERYLHIHNNGANVAFTVEGGRGYLRYSVARGSAQPKRQQNEYSMALIVKTFRLVAGSHWRPSEIQFAHHEPADTADHRRVFDCPVTFGAAANALVVEHDFVERLIPAADEKLYRVLKQHAERILNEVPRENDFPGAVRQAIAELIAQGEPKRERVAEKLGMSARTLERRLKEHGVAYRDLVNGMRRQFALDYLRDRERTVTEVAFLLGYSEVSPFNRAFKRWTGSTPMEYRAGVSR